MVSDSTKPSDGRLVITSAVDDCTLRSSLEAARADHSAWHLLADLCDNIGARLTDIWDY